MFVHSCDKIAYTVSNTCLAEGEKEEGEEGESTEDAKRRGQKRRFSPIEWDRKSADHDSGSETGSAKRAKVTSTSPRGRGER